MKVGDVGDEWDRAEPEIQVFESGRRSTYSYICVRKSNGREKKFVGMVICRIAIY